MVAVAVTCLIVVGVGGYVVNRTLDRIDRLNSQIVTLEDNLQQTTDDADSARPSIVTRDGTGGTTLRATPRLMGWRLRA